MAKDLMINWWIDRKYASDIVRAAITYLDSWFRGRPWACLRNMNKFVFRVHKVLQMDKVMVLEAGRVIEFDSPQRLLQDKRSIFYSMMKESKTEYRNPLHRSWIERRSSGERPREREKSVVSMLYVRTQILVYISSSSYEYILLPSCQLVIVWVLYNANL